MADGSEAVVGFVGAHGDAFELFEFAEEVFDQMTPFVHLAVDGDGFGPALMLGDDDFGTALVQFGNDGIAVEGLVGDQSAERDRSEEHTSELQSLMRRSYAVLCLKKKHKTNTQF